MPFRRYEEEENPNLSGKSHRGLLMKKTFKRILLISLTVLACIFMFAGCSFGVTKESLKDKYNLSACVTYYANGEAASFTPGSGIREKNVYYPSGVQPYEIPADNLKYDKHKFDAWYEVELDEEGNPCTLDPFTTPEGKVYYTYKLGDIVDFSKITLKENDHLYVAAGWVADTSVHVKLVHEGDKNIQIPLDTEKIPSNSPVYGKEYVSYGDTVRIANYSRSGELATISPDFLYFTDNAYTFLEYYEDEACTMPVKWPLVKQDKDVNIYAKYIEGDWTIVNTAKDVKAMFDKTGKNERYWINADIDCSGIEASAVRANFACEIQGNGHTISNLTVKKSQASLATSMFGTLTETAKIENLNFIGLKLEFTFKPGNYSAYFVFTAIKEGAIVHNVTLEGDMNIYSGKGTIFINLDDDNRDNCLYGGYETDAAYEAENENGFSFTRAPIITTGLTAEL